MIADKKQWRWRAVDQDGFVPDVLVQNHRNTKAANRLMRRFLKGQGHLPRVIITAGSQRRHRQYHRGERGSQHAKWTFTTGLQYEISSSGLLFSPRIIRKPDLILIQAGDRLLRSDAAYAIAGEIRQFLSPTMFL